MIDPQRVEKIKYLLARGRLSHRAIAVRVGVGRNVVDNIARGTRTQRISKAHREELGLAGERATDEVTARRCPGCGALVYGECRACGLVVPREEARGEARGEMRAKAS